MANESGHDDADGLRDRFRAALERKQHKASHSENTPNGQRQKVNDAHGRAGGKRTFRRKSG